MGKDPEPAQGTGEPPTGFIDMERRGLEQFLANSGILGLDFGRDAGQGMGESAWVSRKPKWSCNTAQVLRMGRPFALFKSAAMASARGPSWTAAAPVAWETCKGWRELALSPQQAQVAW